ncbi:hypothetical protein SNE40_000299 [Patella caerulea]|uniref:Uncharacterized protein n=1 Tax=Patella caerulea TaxID=87958 RepID=A0AAN8KBY9_PATCE
MFKLFVFVLCVTQSLSIDLTVQPYGHGSEVVEAVVSLIRENCILPNDNLLLRRLAYVESRDGTLPLVTGYFGGIWRIDQDMLSKTKQKTPTLTPLHTIIQQKFNRDWSAVSWPELVKPLYSGLAAALFIAQSVDGNVPQNVEEQGSYWETYYRNGTSAYNYTNIVNLMTKGCIGNEAIDLMFIVDSSSSLSRDDFDRAKLFVKNVIEEFTISSTKTRVGVIRYSSQVYQAASFSSPQNKASIEGLIDKLSYESGKTATASALDAALADFQANPRPSSIKAVVLITDGKSDDSIDTHHATDRLKTYGAVIFAIGVGKLIDMPELEYIATPPTCIHSFTVENFQAINSLVEEIQHSVCRAPLYANRTVTCEIGHCPPYAFPLSSLGLTITANITCGVTNIYSSVNQQYPSQASYGIHSTVMYNKPSEFYQEYTGQEQFLYVKVDNKMSDGKTYPNGCWVTLTPHQGQISHAVYIYCEENGVKRNCTQEELCPNGQLPGYNPCTKENLSTGKTKFPYPGDNTKFYLCDLSGNSYVVSCPSGQVFSPSCENCYGLGTGVISNCDNSNSSFNYLCTEENLIAGKYYFAHPDSISLYIQCDPWGHAFVRTCLNLGSNFVWQESKLTCEPRDTRINPCPHMSIDGERFYAFPPDRTKFIECNDQLDPLVINCPPGLIWDDCVKTCSYKTAVGIDCHIDPKGPLAGYIPKI